jgi:hypothetical protein
MLYLLVPSRLTSGGYDAMVRTPADIAHVNLRIREDLRNELEREAKAHQVSLNYELASRLQQSLEQPRLLSIHQLADSAGRMLLPLIERGHELNLENDLIAAAEGLVKWIQPLLAAGVIAGPEGEAARRAIDKVVMAIKMIEVQRAIQLRHTRGAPQ